MFGKYTEKIQFMELIDAPDHQTPLPQCASQTKNAQCPVYLVCLRNRDTAPLISRGELCFILKSRKTENISLKATTK